MQNIFNTVKGKALGVAEYLTPVLKESKFLETGVITPEEFVAAGDHLTHFCPTWRWEAGDPSYTRPYLPADKQFLVTKNVPCYKRVKQMEIQTEERVIPSMVDDGEGWIDTSPLEGDVVAAVQEMTLDSDDESSQKQSTSKESRVRDAEPTEDDDEEAVDMDQYMADGMLGDSDDEEEEMKTASDQASVLAQAAACSSDATTDDDGILATRTYDLHITYDKYYQTPRLWLTGYDECRQPLSVEMMYEDFSQDHANKTITVESHPHLPGGQAMASVHPCKHADTMKQICERVTEGGRELQVHIYLIVFLKFMQAIIPTVEYDFTHNFTF